MTKAFDNPTLTVNNQLISYVPGSFTFKDGEGEDEVHAQTNGAGITVVTGSKVETRVGMMKWEMRTDSTNLPLKRIWKSMPDRLVVEAVQVYDDGSQITRTMEFGTMTNDPDVESGAESTFEVELMGPPLGIG